MSLCFFFFLGAAQSNANDQDASLAHLAKTEVSYLHGTVLVDTVRSMQTADKPVYEVKGVIFKKMWCYKKMSLDTRMH